MNDANVKMVECPRDAMQGWKNIISTDRKIAYLEALLQVSFDTLDCGSFVSAKAIPQMADTAEALRQLPSTGKTKLLVIVANLRGAEEAVQFENITYLGFPFSLSETFQQRNANSSIQESFKRVQQIQQLCLAHNKQLVIYLSMGFGNPYGDTYDQNILMRWAGAMVQQGIQIISLADTVGVATPEQITFALETLIPKYTGVEFGVHLHSTPYNWQSKMDAAWQAGCRRFDGALKGIGGCPMANDQLVGNMNTEWIIQYLNHQQREAGLDEQALLKALKLADEIFI